MKTKSVLFHVWGLSCLGGAIFLEFLVLLEIAFQGVFIGVEPNAAVLAYDVASALFSLAYFLWLVRRTLRSLAEG